METGRLVAWHKKPGEAVHKGDVLAEVESDKAIMDVEAFADGYLQGPLAEPDSELPVGAVIGYLSDTAEAREPERESTSEPVPEPPPAPEKAAVGREERRRGDTPDKVKTSPYARALARELGIDLGLVPPGPDGTLRSPQVVAAALQGPAPDLSAGPPWKLVPLTTMRRSRSHCCWRGPVPWWCRPSRGSMPSIPGPDWRCGNGWMWALPWMCPRAW